MNNNEGIPESLDFLERIKKMLKMETAVLGKQPLVEDHDKDEALTVDFGPRLQDFEENLKQTIEVFGDNQAKIDFNLKLDKKLIEYKERVDEFASIQDSVEYKDSLYKLIISKLLRFLGPLKLEEAYNSIEEMVGINNVDGVVFNNAWKVIKNYAEGGKNFGGTGLK